jgi:hypothetical protein
MDKGPCASPPGCSRSRQTRLRCLNALCLAKRLCCAPANASSSTSSASPAEQALFDTRPAEQAERNRQRRATVGVQHVSTADPAPPQQAVGGVPAIDLSGTHSTTWSQTAHGPSRFRCNGGSRARERSASAGVAARPLTSASGAQACLERCVSSRCCPLAERHAFQDRTGTQSNSPEGSLHPRIAAPLMGRRALEVIRVEQRRALGCQVGPCVSLRQLQLGTRSATWTSAPSNADSSGLTKGEMASPASPELGSAEESTRFCQSEHGPYDAKTPGGSEAPGG